MISTPLVSIITVCFNAASTIQKTVESVAAQDYPNIEYIIIDNCSTDNTLEIIRSTYKNNEVLQIISEPDDGISDAFNKGIKNAKGTIINILNADDYYLHKKVITSSVEALKKDDIYFAHSDMLFIDETHGTNIRKPLLCSLEYAFPFNHPTMFLKKAVYEKYGLYDVNLKYTMDFEFICRLYQSPGRSRYQSKYIDGVPSVAMQAGGESWVNEYHSIKEIKQILLKYDFLTPKARGYLLLRGLRIKIKHLLTKVGLHQIIKLWRDSKWQL